MVRPMVPPKGSAYPGTWATMAARMSADTVGTAARISAATSGGNPSSGPPDLVI